MFYRACSKLTQKRATQTVCRPTLQRARLSDNSNAYTSSLPGGKRLEDLTMATNTKLNIVIPNKEGSLQEVLNCFKKHQVSLSYIKSDRIPDDFARDRGRFCRTITERAPDIEIRVEFPGLKDEPKIQALMDDVKKATLFTMITSSYRVPWFPRSLKDLDRFADKCMMAGEDLQSGNKVVTLRSYKSDHPGFNDVEYKTRRKHIAKIAEEFKFGSPIPFVEYTDSEKKTWATLFNSLTALYPQYACTQYLNVSSYIM